MTYIIFLTNGISKNYGNLFIIAFFFFFIYNNGKFRLSEAGFTMFKSFNQQYYSIMETFIFIMHLFGQ